MSQSKPTAETKAEVQQLIQRNKVLVFAKLTCPYCTATKVLLKRKGIEYETINVDTTCKSMTGHIDGADIA